MALMPLGEGTKGRCLNGYVEAGVRSWGDVSRTGT
jgi:hypothetical protein